jgi:integrase
MNTVMQLRPSTSEKPTVSPRRWKKNLDYRSQEYLDEAQIERLVVTAGKGRNPERDRLLILMGFRHALRVSELVGLRWQQISLDKATDPDRHGLVENVASVPGHLPLAGVLFDSRTANRERRAAANGMTKEEARRIAANIVKLPKLVRRSI